MPSSPTPAQVHAKIDADLPDNAVRQITEPILRGVLHELVDGFVTGDASLNQTIQAMQAAISAFADTDDQTASEVLASPIAGSATKASLSGSSVQAMLDEIAVYLKSIQTKRRALVKVGNTQATNIDDVTENDAAFRLAATYFGANVDDGSGAKVQIAGEINVKDTKGAINVGHSAGRYSANKATNYGWLSGFGSNSVEETNLGDGCGIYASGSIKVNVGKYCGLNSSGSNQFNFGWQCGEGSSVNNQVNVGFDCGKNSNGTNQINFGWEAGYFCWTSESINIGVKAGYVSSGYRQLNIGNDAGKMSAGQFQVNIGSQAGELSSAQYSMFFGNRAKEMFIANSSASFVANFSGNNIQATGIAGYVGITASVRKVIRLVQAISPNSAYLICLVEYVSANEIKVLNYSFSTMTGVTIDIELPKLITNVVGLGDDCINDKDYQFAYGNGNVVEHFLSQKIRINIPSLVAHLGTLTAGGSINWKLLSNNPDGTFTIGA